MLPLESEKGWMIPRESPSPSHSKIKKALGTTLSTKEISSYIMTYLAGTWGRPLRVA